MAKITRVEIIELLEEYTVLIKKEKTGDEKDWVLQFLKQKFPEIEDAEKDIWGIIVTNKNGG